MTWHPGDPPEVEILDQTRLPHDVRAVRTSSSSVVADAIRGMQVRGAPAIGIAAAFGVALAAHEAPAGNGLPAPAFWGHVEEACSTLAATRPTAVNLFWAIDRMRQRIAALRAGGADAVTVRAALNAEAVAILDEDVAACHAIGTHGMALLRDGDSVLTHCNAGALATGAWGTALAPVFLAHRAGVRLHVYVDETRPFLQGARLTAWELQAAGIDCTLITDNMAAHFMGIGRVSKVIVGADRIAANGDVANKIGTYGLAIIAHAHGIPMYVAAPTSTIDLSLASGAEIPIEYRDPAEVTSFRGTPVAPHGVNASHPAFDVTPSRLVAAIITEVGVHRAPYGPPLAAAVASTSRLP
ncbi:MAG: S-methyl-5-thioribose-1-phosphate isomerase [Chloroflexi bacterium]|nr:S-methyl-5-thioribose-1-phosphate isomerase [Chloroflexota bacterium]